MVQVISYETNIERITKDHAGRPRIRICVQHTAGIQSLTVRFMLSAVFAAQVAK